MENTIRNNTRAHLVKSITEVDGFDKEKQKIFIDGVMAKIAKRQDVIAVYHGVLIFKVDNQLNGKENEPLSNYCVFVADVLIGFLKDLILNI